MTGLPFWHIDAFAEGPFAGNPAAVMLLDRWREEAGLERIAREMNLPASAFVVAAEGKADFEIRWFSPQGEIALCGHGTLAAAHALIGPRRTISFAPRPGGLIKVARDADRYVLTLSAIRTLPMPLPKIAAALGGDPRETRWNEQGYALCVYPDEAAIHALRPDMDALAALGDIQVSATARGVTTDIVSRVFNRHGEDAATGSAHAVLAPYWAAQLGRAEFSALQASARGGRLDCRLDNDEVMIKGRCETIAEGRFLA